MDKIELLLQKSHKQYSQIIQLMESMEKTELSNNVYAVTNIGKQLLLRQKAIETTDKKIMQFLNAPPHTLKEEDIIKRTELLEKVSTLNKLITPKFTAIKSLIFSELQQLKNGRYAIKGYQQSKSTTGHNLNSSL